jgi:hypothetical protein
VSQDPGHVPLGIRATESFGDAECDLSSPGHTPTKSLPRQKSLSAVTAITAQSALNVTMFTMGGDNLISTHLCPSCGRLMGLTRTLAAGQGYSELRTYGCRECGVWVTEGSAPRDHLKDAFIGRKRPSFR